MLLFVCRTYRMFYHMLNLLLISYALVTFQRMKKVKYNSNKNRDVKQNKKNKALVIQVCIVATQQRKGHR